MRTYYVYILGSATGKLYTGVTNDIRRRVFEHKTKIHAGYTALHNISRLLYYESTTSILNAIAREKQIKGWRREKRVFLIEKINPTWDDLSAGWY